MSKKIINAQSNYVASLELRIATAHAKQSSASNIDKLTKMRDAFASSSELTSLFVNSKISADVFSAAIYATEKVIRFAAQSVNHKIALNNMMMYCAFRTAMNAYVNRETLRLSDIVACCSASEHVADDRKSIVYQNSEHKDASTVKAQHQTSLDALRSLNIITARADKRNEYDVNMNALATALCATLKIDTTQIEIAEVAEIAA